VIAVAKKPTTKPKKPKASKKPKIGKKPKQGKPETEQ
jgi:hypothetical protein